MALGLIGAPASALAQVTVDLAISADVVIQGAGDVALGRAGDVNGDGFDDLIIGDSDADPKGRRDAGASHVIFGGGDLPAVIDFADRADLVIKGAAAGDRSGVGLGRAGDVNGDGVDDLIIGADPNGHRSAGASYVVFGGPAAAIERFIATVEAADLPSQLENSLTTKLSKALEHVTTGEINRAITRLRRVIDQVKRNRGRIIDETEADAWRTDAKGIIEMLS
jgi:hypothetical protein